MQKSKLAVCLTNLYKLKAQQLERIKNSRIFTDSGVIFDDKRLYLDSLSKSISDLYTKKVESSKATLEKYLAKLDALNPAAVLKRGFASVKDDRGKIIKSVKNLEKGSFIDVTFADGCAKCSVNSVAEGR